MSEKSIFKIRNLICSYNNLNDVLLIDNLDILEGKITILLGESGSGKSTMLETLGLMNNTIKKGSSVIFQPDNKSYDFYDLWANGKNNDMSLIRRKYFSFIFQDTNLMPNFTAYENISVTQMIEGTSKEDAIGNARRIADSLGLSINETKKAFEMSGGEKQRAAFIRAIAPKFTVLFGDEPTGNLDKKNASLLLSLLKDSIRKHKKTAIIVSHDINLALEFGDTILVLKKVIDQKTHKEYSIINNDTVFNSIINDQKKKIWMNYKGKDITLSVKRKIDSIINN